MYEHIYMQTLYSNGHKNSLAVYFTVYQLQCTHCKLDPSNLDSSVLPNAAYVMEICKI